MIAPDEHAAVAAAVEANRWAFFRACTASDAVTLREDGETVWIVSGVPAPAFNGVLRTEVPPERVDGTIAALSRTLDAQGVPWSWYVGPSAWPVDLDARLEAHGFTLSDEAPGMAAALTGAPPAPAELRFERIRQEADLAAFGTLIGLAFEMPAEIVDPFLRLLGASGAAPEPVVRNYVAFDGGEPVACGSLVVAAGVAGLYNIGVPPERQGKGIGRAMTAALMAEGHASGARTAVLTSSAEGLSCYRGLGFEERCRLREYVPPGGAEA